MKTNCWEFRQCGRQSGGEKVDELGECPAAKATEHNGKNDGENAGRYCWKVAGTFCNARVQGTYATKLFDCIKCDFYKQVEGEEHEDFMP